MRHPCVAAYQVVRELLPKRWLNAIPLVYRDNWDFWDRDNGLLTLGMQKIGVDARFVALGKAEVRKDLPLILGELEQWREPDWWKQWGADGVLFNSWGAPRYEPIARAIKASGARLVIRLDSGGFKSPRTHFVRYLQNIYTEARDFGARPAALYALAKTLCFRFFPAVHDRGTLRHYEHADAILIESPLAEAMVARYLRGLGREDLAAKLRVVAHPINEEFCYDPQIAKAQRVLVVGRYNVYVKDTPLLMRILEQALQSNTDYTANLVGPGAEVLQRWHSRLPEALRQRIIVVGRFAWCIRATSSD
jgi:hypothetical protein